MSERRNETAVSGEGQDGTSMVSGEELEQLRRDVRRMRDEAERMRDEAAQMKAEIAEERDRLQTQLAVLDDRGGQWSDYLEIRGLHVEFDGFVAVKNLDLTVMHGDLRFLIGPNGAGKTTIIDAITGLVPADGSATFRGEQLIGRKPNEIVHLGVGRTFQTASVVEELTVLQNLQIAEGFRKKPRELFAKPDKASQNVEYMMDVCNLKDDADKLAGTLPHGKKQWLEIGMLLMQRPKLILLDEPVAGMTDAETERTAELCLELKKNHTLVVVEHDMSFIDTISEKVTVLAQGAILAEGTLAEVQANEDVIEKYLGR